MFIVIWQNKICFQAERLTNVVPCTIAQIHKMPESEENLKVGSLAAKIVSIFFQILTMSVLFYLSKKMPSNKSV